MANAEIVFERLGAMSAVDDSFPDLSADRTMWINRYLQGQKRKRTAAPGFPILSECGHSPKVDILLPESGDVWELWIPEVLILNDDHDRHFEDTGPVAWTSNGAALMFYREVRESDQYGVNMHVRMWPEEHCVRLECHFKNTGIFKWGERAHAAVCLRPHRAPAFRDKTGKQTYVNSGGQLQDLYSLCGERLLEDVHNHFWVAPLVDQHDSRAKQSVENGVVIRQKSDATECVIFSWNSVARVDVNYNHLNCIHSHPSLAGLAPGDERAVTGLVEFRQGAAADH